MSREWTVHTAIEATTEAATSQKTSFLIIGPSAHE
jgi:hypothetical protein